jgi:hypothetical protein
MFGVSLMIDDRPNRQIEGDTLQDEWEENPDPPEGYGRPDPQVILEDAEGYSWYWHTRNLDADLRYEGDSVEIED